MKKILSFFLISCFSLFQLFGMTAKNNLEHSARVLKEKVEDFKIDQTKFQKFASGLSTVSANVQSKVKATFNWVADRIDTILTKKGAIKTLLILGPLFATYCYFFPPEPVQKLIKYIVGSSTQGATEIAKTAVEALKNNKEDIRSLVVDVMQEVGSAQSTIKINQEIGEMQAFFNSLFSLNGGWTIGLGLYKVVDAGIKLGVPFVLGLLVQNRLKPPVKSDVSLLSK